MSKKKRNLHLGLHEFFTAVLLLSHDIISIENRSPLFYLNWITDFKDNRIIGKVKNIPEIFTDLHYAVLAQALSAVKVIKTEICPREIDRIYLTDSYWPEEIKRFNIEKYGMKRYNSSDIVIESEGKYYGVSLKRKKYTYQKDPPFLNKSFRTILSKDPVHSHILEEYNKNENEVFSSIVQKAINDNIVSAVNYSGNWKEYIGKIDNKYINLCLQSNPIIQRFCSSVFLENTDLQKLLYTIALRNDINELEDSGFYFSVVLGIGNVRNDKLEVLEGQLINKTEQELKISVRYNGRYSSGIICYI